MNQLSGEQYAHGDSDGDVLKENTPPFTTIVGPNGTIITADESKTKITNPDGSTEVYPTLPTMDSSEERKAS